MPAPGERSGRAIADACAKAFRHTQVHPLLQAVAFTVPEAIALAQGLAPSQAFALAQGVSITFAFALAETIPLAQAIADPQTFPDPQTHAGTEAGRGTG